LYDLKNDPHEWNNLGSHPEYANLVDEFKAKLADVAWNSPMGEPLKAGESKQTAAKPKKKRAATEWDWFGALDANKDGAVSEAEWLKQSQAKAIRKGTPYDEAKQKGIFTGHDRNGDGRISREELEKPNAGAFLKTQGKAEPAALDKTLKGINDRFENVDVRLLEWPGELKKKLGNLKRIAFMAFPVKQAAGKVPLLVSLHGAGGRKMSLVEQLTRSAEVKGLGLAELAGKELILLEPNSADIWNVSSLNTMLDFVLENHPEIDTNRIYVMGHSMGGWGTWAWINESADRFAAAAPSGFSAGDTGDVERLLNLPIWAMVGGDDKRDRVRGIKQMVERLRASGNKQVKHTVFAGADHAAGNAAVFSSMELVDWMLGFSRGE
jgi:hypothetical protein